MIKIFFSSFLFVFSNKTSGVSHAVTGPVHLLKAAHKRCIVSVGIHSIKQNGLVNPKETIALSRHMGLSTIYFNLLASQEPREDTAVSHC